MKNKTLEKIKQSGYLTVSDYMDFSNKAYYEKKDIFGKDGDFVTSPEISQVFGELIAIFFITIWHQNAKPNPFRLVELGAGKGTMMCDILRIAKQVPDFLDCLTVHIVEKSNKLKQVQNQNILKENKDIKIYWHDDIKDLPKGFASFIGNEFLDALPITQLFKKQENWFERVVVSQGEKLKFDIMPDKADQKITNLLSKKVKTAPNGNIAEINLNSLDYIDEISAHIKENQGVCLLIDYGHKKSNYGETLQAILKHKFVDVLDFCEEADLTAHVDFQSIGDRALENNMKLWKIQSQRDFLKGLGIEYRIQKLAENKPLQVAKNLVLSMSRLIDEDKMGDLFKVICFSDKNLSTPPSF